MAAAGSTVTLKVFLGAEKEPVVDEVFEFTEDEEKKYGGIEALAARLEAKWFTMTKPSRNERVVWKVHKKQSTTPQNTAPA